MHQPIVHIVVELIAGESEVVEVGASTAIGVALDGGPVVVAEGGPEAIDRAAYAVITLIVADELAVVLADVVVNGVGRTVGIVVVADGEDEVGVPASDERGNTGFVDGVGAVVADDGEAEGVAVLGCCWGGEDEEPEE